MTTRIMLAAALTLAALPTFAGAPAKLLTPSSVLGSAKTIQFTATVYRTEKINFIQCFVLEETYTVALKQPNQAYIKGVDAATRLTDYISVCNGKTLTVYNYDPSRSGDTYTKLAPPVKLANVSVLDFPMSLFLTSAALAGFHLDAPGVYRKILVAESGRSSSEVLTLNLTTGLPISLALFEGARDSSTQPVTHIVFSGWKLNAPLSDSNFAYTPPADAKLSVVPKLLANGTAAPDFTVHDKDGKAVKLSDYRGKTIVLDFWATWCGPCQKSMPHMTEVAKKYADKNVIVLAVNVWDTPKAFQAWLPKHREYAALNFAVDTSADQDKSVATALYGVNCIPTQYVIDSQGKIVKSIVGYMSGDTQLEDALWAGQK